MADISTFPTIHQVYKGGGTILNYTAGEAIKAGQVVGFAATGVSDTVVVMDATTGERCIGVAVYGAASGEQVAVASIGARVTVANADDTTAIDAGSLVEQNDNSVGGTVSAVDESATGGATVTTHWGVVGIAVQDIVGGGTGDIIVFPIVATQANSS